MPYIATPIWLWGQPKNLWKHVASQYSKKKELKFVLEELIKAKHVAPPPFRISGEPYFDAGNPFGSIQEVYDYWKRNKSELKDKRIISIVAKHLNSIKGV